MNFRVIKTISCLAGLSLAAVTVEAQYAYTRINVPGARPGNVLDTFAYSISGTNIVGTYTDTNGVNHGFLYNGGAYVTLDCPLAGSGAGQGTQAVGIRGTNIVGGYTDNSGDDHGFLLSDTNWSTLDDPWAGQGTAAQGNSVTDIVGTYIDTNGFDHGFLLSGTNWTTLDDALAWQGSFPNGGTYPQGIEGTNIVGFYVDINGFDHGFLLSGTNWTTLDDPEVWSNPGRGYGSGFYHISGSTIVGAYQNLNNPTHGLLYDTITSMWTTLDDPLGADGTIPADISGGIIVGWEYDSLGHEHGFIATPVPRLTMSSSGSSQTVSWPYSPFVNWSLQQNPDLTTTNWTTTVGVSNDVTNNFITITSPKSNLFFRLRQQ